MRQMYDSDNLDAIPAEAEIVAFYADDEPGTATPEQLVRFAGKVLVPITRKVGVKAKVADIEPGCIWPPSAARVQFDNGDSDTAYCSWDNVPAVVFALQGSPGFKYLWVANFDGQDSELPSVGGVEVVSKQYANSVMTGGHYDLSVVSDSWPVPAEGAPVVSNVQQNPPVHADPNDAPIEAADDKVVLQAPIVDAVYVSGGCYMVAADGGVFREGAAVFHGSMAGVPLAHAVCAILVTDHSGYTLVAEDGGTFRFGNGPEVAAL